MAQGKNQFSRLTSKGLVVIAVPVLFSIAVILVLKVLLHEAQKEADRENRSKQIIASATGLGSSVVLAVTDRYMTRFSAPGDADSRLESSSKLVMKRFGELKDLVAGDPVQEKLADRIGSELRRGLEITSNQEFAKVRMKGLAQLSVLMERRKQMQEIFAHISSDTSELIENERKNQAGKSLNHKKFRQFIDLVLLAGVAGDVALAVVLMYLFSRDITGRLGVLMENSRLLVDDRPLNAPIGGNDEISELDAVFHDAARRLSEARENERAILARLKSIVDTIPLGLLVVDGNGIISTISPSGEALFGRSSGDAQGQSISRLLRPKRHSDTDWVREFLADESSLPKEMDGLRADDSVFPGDVIVSRYNTANMTGHLIVVTDVSQRHEMERMKQSFVSIVSHELRSPLTSVGFCLKMLSRNHFGELTAEGAENVKMAEVSVGRLVSLVNEILDAERLESGNISVNPSLCKIGDVLGQAVASVQAVAMQAGVNLVTEPSTVELVADANRLAQVLVNLIANAVKFSEPGTTVNVEVEESDDSVEIRVADQGRGVPDEQKDLVFKRFHQVSSDDSKIHRGTGLGLAISKAIVDAHGGEIGVRDNDGRGSIFWFKIPTRKTAVPGKITQ